MKKLFWLVILASLVVFLTPGCRNPLETNDLTAVAKGLKAPGGKTPLKGDLIAGKHIKVGTVTTSNDMVWNGEESLYVTFSLVDGWIMTESYLAVASSLNEIPQTEEHNPIPNQFPYQMVHDLPLSDFTYTIPLDELYVQGGDVLYIAAHAEVQRVKSNGKVKEEESAWAAGEEGQEFEGNKWATYFCYRIESVWDGDYVILNVDDLAGYTGITGSLTISHSNLPNLAWLSSLTFVGGNLNIEYNPNLTNLTGLEGLISVGGRLWIYSNESLTNLTGLEGLTTIDRYLLIHYNDSLTSLTGLEGLTSIGEYLYIIGNHALTSLTGLEGLTSIGEYLLIHSNDDLTSLTGLEGLTSIGGNLEIDANQVLTSLTGLNSLTSVGEDLWITNNIVLQTSLADLRNHRFAYPVLKIPHENHARSGPQSALLGLDATVSRPVRYPKNAGYRI